MRELGLDAPPHPRTPGAVPSPGGAGRPMEVSCGDPRTPRHPPGLREGLEVTVGDCRGLGGGRARRTATVRRDRTGASPDACL